MGQTQSNNNAKKKNANTNNTRMIYRYSTTQCTLSGNNLKCVTTRVNGKKNKKNNATTTTNKKKNNTNTNNGLGLRKFGRKGLLPAM